jgi:hypothetical protein
MCKHAFSLVGSSFYMPLMLSSHNAKCDPKRANVDFPYNTLLLHLVPFQRSSNKSNGRGKPSYIAKLP